MFYIDFEELDKFLQLKELDTEETVTTTDSDGKVTVTRTKFTNLPQMNGIKYELVMDLYSRLMTYAFETDGSLMNQWMDGASIDVLIAYDNLIKLNIIKEYGE